MLCNPCAEDSDPKPSSRGQISVGFEVLTVHSLIACWRGIFSQPQAHQHLRTVSRAELLPFWQAALACKQSNDILPRPGLTSGL